MGEVKQTRIEYLSIILYLVKIPKKNKPSNGPYVYPAALKIELITLWSFISLKIRGCGIPQKIEAKQVKNIPLYKDLFFKFMKDLSLYL